MSDPKTDGGSNVTGQSSRAPGKSTASYDLDQYFPTDRQVPIGEAKSLRKELGYLRTFFVLRRDRFRSLQRNLNQGRFGTSYDMYLVRATYYALGAGILGLLLVLLSAAAIASTGVLATSEPLITLPAEGPLRALSLFIIENQLVISGALIAGLGFTTFAAGTWGAFYYYPRVVADRRRRNINVLLPHALVYMYALSRGGHDPFDVMDAMADGEDTYGAVAEEFDMLVRNIEVFGNDLYTAIRNVRNLTPSDSLEKFFDDMLNALDSGSDFTTFLEEESDRYLKQAREEQNALLELLELLSEIFITAFVAAPLFFIVTLLMVSVLGGSALLEVYMILYIVLPLGMLALFLVIDYLSQPFSPPSDMAIIEPELEESTPTVADQSDLTTLSTYVTAPIESLIAGLRGGETTDSGEGNDATATTSDDRRLHTFERAHQYQTLRHILTTPITQFRERTHYASLLVTGPLTLVAVWALVETGFVTPSIAAYNESPVRTTIGFFVVPFLVVTIPLMVLYEFERRRIKSISERFPEVLNIVASANRMGIPLTESLMLVSRWSEGTLADELRKLRNDITWNHNVKWSLIRFANRIEIPQISRTIKLIAEGSHSSSDLAHVINIAAEDTHNRRQLEQKRHTELQTYLIIVIIGYLVYLTVIVMLNTSYLGPIADISASASSAATQGTLISVTDVPVTAYRTVFFHTALIQGIGTGLIAGKLVDDEALSGLKYSIALVFISVGVFTFL